MKFISLKHKVHWTYFHNASKSTTSNTHTHTRKWEGKLLREKKRERKKRKRWVCTTYTTSKLPIIKSDPLNTNISELFQRLLLEHEIVIWHPNLASPQSYLWWQKRVLSWNGCFILFLPVAVQPSLSIYIHYCAVRTVRFFITSLAWDALIQFCCHFWPFSISPHFHLLKIYRLEEQHTPYNAVQNKQHITN